MKLLVTGGLGFIGSNFIRFLIANYPDYEIVNIDKMGTGANRSSLKDFEGKANYHFVRGNICNPQLLKKTIADVDAVVNIAAETHVDRSIADPHTFLENNTIGTYTILNALTNYNPTGKMVQVSTDEVYGEITQGSFTEKDPPKPGNPYSASKAAADMLITAYHETYDLDATITRCTNNYGPYQFPEKLIPKTVIRALNNLSIPIYGTGMNRREWIYVQDHCSAIHTVLQKGQAGQIYNVSSGNEISNIDLVKQILVELDKPDTLITHIEDRPGHDFRYSLDSTKIRAELGWAPKHSFGQTLKSTVEWYIQNREWWTLVATPKILDPTPWKRGRK